MNSTKCICRHGEAVQGLEASAEEKQRDELIPPIKNPSCFLSWLQLLVCSPVKHVMCCAELKIMTGGYFPV